MLGNSVPRRVLTNLQLHWMERNALVPATCMLQQSRYHNSHCLCACSKEGTRRCWQLRDHVSKRKRQSQAGSENHQKRGTVSALGHQVTSGPCTSLKAPKGTTDSIIIIFLFSKKAVYWFLQRRPSYQLVASLHTQGSLRIRAPWDIKCLEGFHPYTN